MSLSNDQIGNLVEQVKPILQDQDLDVIGPVLGYLIASWLACQEIEGDREATRAMQADQLKKLVQYTFDILEQDEAIKRTVQ